MAHSPRDWTYPIALRLKPVPKNETTAPPRPALAGQLIARILCPRLFANPLPGLKASRASFCPVSTPLTFCLTGKPAARQFWGIYHTSRYFRCLTYTNGKRSGATSRTLSYWETILFSGLPSFVRQLDAPHPPPAATISEKLNQLPAPICPGGAVLSHSISHPLDKFSMVPERVRRVYCHRFRGRPLVTLQPVSRMIV